MCVCVGTVLVACGRKLQKGFRYVGTKGQVLHAPALAVKSHLRQKKAEGVESANPGWTFQKGNETGLETRRCMFVSLKAGFFYIYI